MLRGLKILVIIALFAAAGFSDTIVLRDGTRYEGSFVTGSDSGGITFNDQNGMNRHFSLGEVERIEFNSQSGAYRSSSSGYGSGSASSGYDRSGTYSSRSSSTVAGSRAMTIPAGAQLTVRTNQAIDVQNAQGQVFSGSVDQDVPGENGSVAIPRGSDVELVVREIDNNEMALDLDSVVVNGQRYALESAESSVSNEKEGLGANKRTGKYVGGGALLGAIIGGIAGGGKGAAIGAITGGAAGAGAQVLTRGKNISVPAESLLTFRLDQPLRLNTR
jgi:hypothetical protein